jgi:hypothetical protein
MSPYEVAIAHDKKILLEDAVVRVKSAQADLDRAQSVCDRWTQAFGLKVWREGRTSDLQKLRERRQAKRRLAYELLCMEDILLAIQSAGSA